MFAVDLIWGWPADDPEPVEGDQHDGQRWHEHGGVGQRLDQPEDSIVSISTTAHSNICVSVDGPEDIKLNHMSMMMVAEMYTVQ